MTDFITDPFDYSALVSAIQSGDRIAFVRYSDGEWNCLLGRKGGIPCEHDYAPDLAEALRGALIPDPAAGYHVGIMPSLLTPGRWWASDRVIEYCTDRPHLQFCSSMIVHNASMAGHMGQLFEALRGVRVAIVGNEAMRAMTPWLGDFRLVEVPPRECWGQRDEIMPRIIAASRQADVVLFCCSIPAKVWIRQAWEADSWASLIDIGSVFDPYVGRQSRAYMREGRVVMAEKPR